MHLFLHLLLTAAASGPQIDVWLPPRNEGPLHQALWHAKRIVTEAYAGIGIKVTWRSGPAPAGCFKSPFRRQVVLQFRPDATTRHNDALAFALPHATEGPCVLLLTGRILRTVTPNPTTGGALLGHVLAHEIGHVLQGIDRHSPSGLMQEHWSIQEIKNMAAKPLRFTDYDKDLILDAFTPPHPPAREHSPYRPSSKSVLPAPHSPAHSSPESSPLSAASPVSPPLRH
ncbi:MAG: hypothetical protein U0R19_07085 [Bryobacteraceae bacterium]